MNEKNSGSEKGDFVAKIAGSRSFIIGHDSTVGNVVFNETQSASEILTKELEFYCKNAFDAFSRGMYGEAVKSFKKASEKSSLPPRACYYLALSVLGGKRPRKLTNSKFKLIENNLRMAARGFPVPGHVYILLAYVKYDFFVSNGMKMHPPSLASLFELAQNSGVEPAAMEELRAHTQIQDFLRIVDG